VRLFLAINLPPAVRASIHRATQSMREAAPHATWVSPDHLHLTLKFLGEQPDDVATTLSDALTPVAAACPRLTLRLRGLGAFPNSRAPRVVWLGVEPQPPLELLHHGLESTCARLGYEVDGRAFRPHVTLARVRERLTPAGARSLAVAAREVKLSAAAAVRSLDVMASHLTSKGPEYTVVSALALGGGDR